jgi:hypothetical protein
MIEVNDIKQLCNSNALRWTNHVLVRLLQRNIKTEDVEYALLNDEIIEQYPTDYPYPSCLALGMTPDNRNLHIVCGIGGGELWLITAYYPDADDWSEDYSVRKGNDI